MSATDEDRNERELVKMTQTLRDLQAQKPLIMEIASLQATMYRHKYLELVKVGFTPEQALELCTR